MVKIIIHIFIYLAIVLTMNGQPFTLRDAAFVAQANQTAAGGDPGGTVSFSDNFNRADDSSLGANWTVLAGSWSVTNNLALVLTYDSQYGKNAAGYLTNCSTVSQYAMVTLDGSQAAGNGIYPSLLFRIDGTNGHYGVQFRVNEAAVRWQYFTNAESGSSTIGEVATTVATNDTWGVTITGTGASTVVRAWLNPTGLPSAADNWDGDTTPTVSLTDDPPNAADTGLGVGIAIYVSENRHCKFEDFFGGDIP